MVAFFESSKITEAWASATATATETRIPAVDAYVTALAAEYSNGSVLYAEFQLDLAEQVLTMSTHFENWKFSQLLDRFWLVPGVRKRLSELGKVRAGVSEHFASADVFELAASLGRVLHGGGAYSKSDRPTAPSVALGTACALALMDGEGALMNGQDALAFWASSAWCEFFLDVAWDYTFVIVAPARRSVRVLLATDTD